MIRIRIMTLKICQDKEAALQGVDASEILR